MGTLSLINQSQLLYKHALVCDVELKNGKRTNAVVIFNNDELDFEQINAGMSYALAHCNIQKSKKTFCSIKNGILTPFAHFPERVYTK